MIFRKIYMKYERVGYPALFKSRVKEIFPDLEFLEEDQALWQGKKLPLICKTHGLFYKRPDNVLSQKQGCPNCTSNKITTESYIKKAKEIHGDKYDLSLIVYTKMHNTIKVICPEHGGFEPFALNFIDGKGCIECGRKSTTEKRKTPIDEIKKIIDTREIYYECLNIEEYQNAHTKLTFVCPIHGEFKQTFINRKDNKRCLKCSRIEQPKKRKLPKEIVKERFTKYHDHEPIMETYVNINTKMKFVCEKYGEFWQIPNLQFTQNQSCPKCYSNKAEKEIIDLYGNLFIYQDRKILYPKEIDFINYKYKFGIEYNGLIYHSFGKHSHSKLNNYHVLNRNHHLFKTKGMEEKGFQLFHIQSIQWNNPIKKEIWKSIINNKFGKSQKIFARKLAVIDLTDHKKFVQDYLNNNHLQGGCGYKIAYGLVNTQNHVYSVMTFGSSRFDKNIEWELLRFCNFKNTRIIGGASKLLKAFERVHKPKSLVSYANRDWSQGNLYKALGFEFITESPPNYFYTDINENIISRYQAQKHKLRELLEAKNKFFNENLSERDNMINNGYRIYYDTGNLVYHKIYKRI